MAAQTHAIPPPVLNGGLYTGTPFYPGILLIFFAVFNILS